MRHPRVTIVENAENKLTCSYTAADGSVVTFDGHEPVDYMVNDSGLRGVVVVDQALGLPAEPLPKPRDVEGREADIWVCVPSFDIEGVHITALEVVASM